MAKPTIQYEAVDVDLTIGGGTFLARSVRTERSTSKDSGMAELKGIFSDGYVPALDDPVTVDINGTRIFTGLAKMASRNQDGVYTVEAYDAARKLATVTQTISSDKADAFNLRVARRGLEKAGVQYQIGSGFSGYDGPTMHNKMEMPVDEVLDDVASRLDGYWWVDEHNVVHLDGNPPQGENELDRIITIGAGEDMTAKNEVVVFGGSPGSDKGQEWAVMFAHERLVSRSKFVGEGNESATKVYKNQNLVTQKEVDAFMRSKIGQFATDLKTGQAKLVGMEQIGIYETVIVPELDVTRDILAGEYQVKKVTHHVDTLQGFTTDIEFGLPMPEVQKAKAGQVSVGTGITQG